MSVNNPLISVANGRQLSETSYLSIVKDMYVPKMGREREGGGNGKGIRFTNISIITIRTTRILCKHTTLFMGYNLFNLNIEFSCATDNSNSIRTPYLWKRQKILRVDRLCYIYPKTSLCMYNKSIAPK